MKVRPLLVVGTRPEAVKMAPAALSFRAHGDFDPVLCLTGQHREMARAVVDYFGLTVDSELDVMRPGQSLAALAARCLEGIDEQIARVRPSCVVAQGDTATVWAAAAAAFFRRTPFLHIEAGLRTGDLDSPWPEEYHRRSVALSTALHCAPTRLAARRLKEEGAKDQSVHVTGNTVVDALRWTVEREAESPARFEQGFADVEDRPMVLVTSHRRENLGDGLSSVCGAVRELARRFPDVRFVFPLHPNPHVQGPARRLLGDCGNVRLTPPAEYPEFVGLMRRAALILTDSGGVQEEAPSLGTPVLLMRGTTERPEGVEAGWVELVGVDSARIVERASARLSAPCVKPTEFPHLYGDGLAAERITALTAAAHLADWNLDEADFSAVEPWDAARTECDNIRR